MDRKEYQRQWKRRKRQDPEFLKKEAENSKKLYHKKKNDKEWLKKRRAIEYEWRKKNHDKVKKWMDISRRKYIEKHPNKRRRWQSDYYIRNSPLYGIRKLLREAANGRITIEELNQGLHRALDRLEQGSNEE